MAQPQRINARLLDILRIQPGLYRLTFITKTRFPRFKDGQFLHLALDEFDPTNGYWPDSRVFSIASEAKDRDAIVLFYSVKGRFTKRMEEELAIGNDYWLKLPYGDFIIDRLAGDSKVVLIAGGTGLSAFLGYVRRGIHPNKVTLAYGVKSPDHLIERDVLRSLDGDEGIDVLIFDESGSERGFKSVVPGMIDIERVVERSEVDASFFISGPPGMIRSFSDRLVESGVDPSDVHFDNWE